MEYITLFEAETRLMNIIWDSEPLPSGKLVELCRDKLGWKKSTTYTMLKRVEEKGCAKNDQSIVSSLISRNDVRTAESRQLVEQSFSGSLPGFLTAFFGEKKISKKEAEELRRLIDSYEEV